MNQKVNKYLNELLKWQDELKYLRRIILDCGLDEDFKWMHPSYSNKGKNIVLIHEFNDYCAILFHKGTLLKDTENILIQQTENTREARQLRFTNTEEIAQLEDTVKEYIAEAVQIEISGLKVEKTKVSDFDPPEELQKLFAEQPEFEEAFKKLTAGRQKGYMLHFSKPKQSKTKTSRIEGCIKRIMDGYGLNDCVCGLSNRMPMCDGSHKQLEASR
jgi:uncharacterized protein YdeI (YjbR/CyaY-like superfamily)